MKLQSSFYSRSDTVAIARELLGKLIVVPSESGERVSGVIVETEAYLGESDRASHSYGGRRTARNEVTYGPGGYAYVFFIYGRYFQLNIVTGMGGSPHVVLIRAIEPREGIEIMRDRRGPMNDRDLTSGPGKLCIALGVDRRFNGESLLGDRIWIEEARSNDTFRISAGKRVGIDYAGADVHRPWRFWIAGNAYVSKK